ncbi:MAG: hypothetical protein NVSMB9_12010 [Isosphaeraceae bacterium]
MLSALANGSPQAAHSHAAEVAREARQARAAVLETRAARLNIRAARLSAMHSPPAPIPSDPAPDLGKGSVFAVDTAWKGWKLTHSRNVGQVGLNYGKLAVAHDTRKVGAAYIRAGIKGDHKTLHQLGETRIVKKVGSDFSQLSHSRGVRYVGDQFSHFGKSVAKRYHRIFTPKPQPPVSQQVFSSSTPH